VVAALGRRPPLRRKYLEREELAGLYGADPADMAAVESFAARYGLSITGRSSSRRAVTVSGRVSDISEAFEVDLRQYRSSDGVFLARNGPASVPKHLSDVIVGVFGLDNRLQARPHFFDSAGQMTGDSTSPTPTDIADLYDFPSALNGAGECIAIIEFGGGIDSNDLAAFFGNAQPTLRGPILVDGAEDRPGLSEVAEVTLDICVAGAIAPAASIVVYIAPPTERGWIDALGAAIHDDTNKPGIISISWGWPETSTQTNNPFWTKAGIGAINELLKEAALLGITVCCSSGDSGSNADANGLLRVDFPASSPYVLACGGSTVEPNAEGPKTESVWNVGAGGASGGGFSGSMRIPTWQSVPASLKQNASGRGIPDVAGFASGYRIHLSVPGFRSLGGTSAAAPLWAGLLTRINEKLRNRVGYINPIIYEALQNGAPQSSAFAPFHDIVHGNNRTNGSNKYDAIGGWDPCTGWGRPDGVQLMNLLAGQ